MKHLTICGYLGKDAEMTKTDNKKFRLQFNMAVTERDKEKQGNEVENTDWFTCFRTYSKEPKKLLQYLTKGIRVLAEGRPKFGLNSTNNGVFQSLSLNVQNFEILTFEEEKKEGKTSS